MNADGGSSGVSDRRLTPRQSLSLSRGEKPSSQNCEECGEPLPAYEPRRGARRFCSEKCRYRSKDRKRFKPRGTLVVADCGSCGRRFEYRSSTKPRKFCEACGS
jgi:hypothetical protein